jgi:hypothetical protein
VKLSAVTVRRIRSKARADGTTISGVVRAALAAYLPGETAPAPAEAEPSTDAA